MGTAGVGIMSGVLAFGMIIGALVVGIFHVRMSKLNLIIYSFLIYGLLFLIGPFFISRILVMTIALIGGVIFSFITVAQNTMLQEQVSSVIRGRIYSIKEFFVNVTFILTALLVGITSDFTSYKIALVAVGMIVIILSLLALIYLSKLNPPQIFRSIRKE
jgi:MFS family permease